MNAIEQAQELRRRIDQALGGLQQYNTVDFTETEVEFRFDALRMTLIMARNDVKQMIDEWSEEEAANPSGG